MQITKDWSWILLFLLQELWSSRVFLHTGNISQKHLALSLEHYLNIIKYLHRKKIVQGFKSSDKIDDAFLLPAWESGEYV